MRPFFFLIALLGCRAPMASDTRADAGVAVAEDAGVVAIADATPTSIGLTPDRFCLNQLEAEYDDQYIPSTCTVLNRMADVCWEVQPLLSKAAREASCLPERQQAAALIRAARKHPTFSPDCDIADADAYKRSDVAFQGRKGCWSASHDCYLSAGMHVFLHTFYSVASRSGGRYFDHAMLTQFQCYPRDPAKQGNRGLMERVEWTSDRSSSAHFSHS